jgi:hypothetical protein
MRPATSVLTLAVLFVAGLLPTHLRGDEISWPAWDDVLGRAASDPAAKYGLYVYRTLAVPHPDVYLRADLLTSEIIESLPGGRGAYRASDLRDYQFFDDLRSGAISGRPFSWRDWVVIPDSVYDDPITPSSAKRWIDRRSTPVAVLLQAVSPRLNTVEGAVMRFVQSRRSGRSPDSVYVIIDGEGTGYLLDGHRLLRGGIHETSPETSWLKPAIVFNDRATYYPLLGRDDRSRDTALARAVQRLGPVGMLNLPVQALQRINTLRSIARLDSDREKFLAAVLCSGLRDLSMTPVRDAWSRAWDSSGSIMPACRSAMMAAALFAANRLSPATRRLCRMIDRNAFAEGTAELQSSYLSLTGRMANRADTADTMQESWGILWGRDFIDIGIDDIVRTRAGESFSQMQAMSAVLSAAGVDYFCLSLWAPNLMAPEQYWIIAAGGTHQFNLGRWTPVPKAKGTFDRSVLLSTGYGLPGRWVELTKGPLCTDAEPLQIAGELNRISREVPGADIQIRFPNGQLARLLDVSTQIADEQWRIVKMCWDCVTSDSTETALSP